jgi:putative FmdB family regulatory protein
MPTYEYVCAKCDKTFEITQPITSDALTTCPKDVCPRKPWGKGKVKRAISTGGGLIFKGSGFYTTDYRSDSYKEAAKKDASSTSGSSAKESKEAKASKTESKPAATTPAPAKSSGGSKAT